ncbi:MAG: Hpt domain-containing protein [Bacteroidota bacterium]
MKPSKHFNIDILKSITKGNNEMLLDYIKMYLELTPKEINQLKKYFSGKDWDSLEIVAHNIKSKAGYMGIQKMNELAVAIEEYNNKGDTGKSGLKDLIGKVEKLFSIVKTELIQEKNRLGKKINKS